MPLLVFCHAEIEQKQMVCAALPRNATLYNANFCIEALWFYKNVKIKISRLYGNTMHPHAEPPTFYSSYSTNLTCSLWKTAENISVEAAEHPF